jgi:hypothetical protein
MILESQLPRVPRVLVSLTRARHEHHAGRRPDVVDQTLEERLRRPAGGAAGAREEQQCV